LELLVLVKCWLSVAVAVAAVEMEAVAAVMVAVAVAVDMYIQHLQSFLPEHQPSQ
jgi:hypothetical protein